MTSLLQTPPTHVTLPGTDAAITEQRHEPPPVNEQLERRYAALVATLTSARLKSAAGVDREQVKHDIIALFRDADAALRAHALFKEAVKALVSEWKSLDEPVVPVPAAKPTTVRAAVSGRVDHLGASTFIEKGWSKLSLGDAAGAESALRRALEFSPDNNEAETLLGWSVMSQQRYDEALLTFQRVLLRDSACALARASIGYVCLRKEIYGEAIEHLVRAIQIDNDRKATLYAHLYLGMVYSEREMYDDAEQFFARTLELGPNLLQTWYELGRMRWFAGRSDAATEAWRAGAAANKFNPWGKRCAEVLEQVAMGIHPPRRD